MTHDKKLVSFGLKWNPFSPTAPTSAFLVSPAVEHFGYRIEQLARYGGFSLLSGEPGYGKSVALRLLVERLKRLPDMRAGVLTRPQCSVVDLYRELGAIFDAPITPHNRWASTEVLRGRWRSFIEAAIFHPVLIIDDAQEMHVSVLKELRLLTATELDACCLLTVVLAGEDRLLEKLRHAELRSLESRVRVRLTLDARPPEALAKYLKHVLAAAGNAGLIAPSLVPTLCERAGGNLRTLMNLADELLDAAVRHDRPLVDEKLFMEVFAASRPHPGGKRRSGSTGAQRALLP